jgi:hypothetical protein
MPQAAGSGLCAVAAVPAGSAKIHRSEDQGARLPSAMLTAGACSPSGPQQGEQGVNLASESVAGEEDPGASLDMSMGASTPGSDGSAAPGPISEPPAPLHPGDEAPAGTPGTGEGICRECGGSGRLAGALCPACDGSGKVIVGVG